MKFKPWSWPRRSPPPRVGRLATAPAAFAQAKEQFFPVLVVPHRRLRAERHALGQRLSSTTSSWSTPAAASTA